MRISAPEVTDHPRPVLMAHADPQLVTALRDALAVLVYVHRSGRLTATHGRILHGFDIAWTSALTFVSEGPVSWE